MHLWAANTVATYPQHGNGTPVLDDDDPPVIFEICFDHWPRHRHVTVGHIPATYAEFIVFS
jgi:hypothetical protein